VLIIRHTNKYQARKQKMAQVIKFPVQAKTEKAPEKLVTATMTSHVNGMQVTKNILQMSHEEFLYSILRASVCEEKAELIKKHIQN
jgi:hypothetical protein